MAVSLGLKLIAVFPGTSALLCVESRNSNVTTVPFWEVTVNVD